MTEKVIYPPPRPLGPGDSARAVLRETQPAPTPLGPGDGEGDEYESVALPPLGPGDLQVPRPTIRRRRVTGA